jgi:hypothetical protein
MDAGAFALSLVPTVIQLVRFIASHADGSRALEDALREMRDTPVGESIGPALAAAVAARRSELAPPALPIDALDKGIRARTVERLKAAGHLSAEELAAFRPVT